MYSWIYVMNILVPSLKLSRIAYFVLHRQRISQSYILITFLKQNQAIIIQFFAQKWVNLYPVIQVLWKRLPRSAARNLSQQPSISRLQFGDIPPLARLTFTRLCSPQLACGHIIYMCENHSGGYPVQILFGKHTSSMVLRAKQDNSLDDDYFVHLEYFSVY